MSRRERLAQRQDFLKAVGKFLGGTNQVRMSIALQMGAGELYEVATLWREMRASVLGLHGYPTAEEVAAVLDEVL